MSTRLRDQIARSKEQACRRQRDLAETFADQGHHIPRGRAEPIYLYDVRRSPRLTSCRLRLDWRAEPVTIVSHHRLERSGRSSKDCLDIVGKPVISVCSVQMRHRQ